jgi:hypothetical protein
MIDNDRRAGRRGAAVNAVTAETLAETLGRHTFTAAENAPAQTWSEARRREHGGDLCTCGLARRNWRHRDLNPRRTVPDGDDDPVVDLALHRARRRPR